MIVISPTMTVTQLAELIEQNRARDTDVYVRIESYKGRPVAYLVREDTSRSWIPKYLRQAD